MSKSLENFVGVTEPADQMFGKLMSISDELMWRYYVLLTDSRPTRSIRLRIASQRVQSIQSGQRSNSLSTSLPVFIRPLPRHPPLRPSRRDLREASWMPPICLKSR